MARRAHALIIFQTKTNDLIETKTTNEIVTTYALESLSGKVGVVLLVLGAMPFLNLRLFTKLQNKNTRQIPPPLEPQL